jgi:tRNA-dihydrouridine synthase B
MKLGHLQLNQPLFLAPLSGITNYPFRKLAKMHGCDVVFTEMISAEGLIRKGQNLLKIEKDEHPIFVQLFGSDSEILALASEIAEAYGADGIDINMGCPAEQVVRTGAGADLLRFPKKVEKILLTVRKRVKRILTIKIRSGWDEDINAVEISKIAEQCGIDGLFLHPRTKTQKFRGKANWHIIREVKQAIKIPVIGNGDVNKIELIKKMFDETGCDGVMIGRGALGNPWIFDRKRKLPPTSIEKEETIKNHFSLLLNYEEEIKALKDIKRHIFWYTKGLPYSTAFREKISKIKEVDLLFEEIRSYFTNLNNF